MDATRIIEVLGEAVPGVDLSALESIDQPAVRVPRERLVEVCTALRDLPDLQFSFLADITAIDWWPREPRFEVVYLLASPERRLRVRLKVQVPGRDPRVPAMHEVWPAAGWLEREVWDLFGIVFDGHPDLRRVLMPEDWEGHPLRKDYPVQIEMPVKFHSPLQMTEEEFQANIEADREGRKSP
jgi:NADH-quinone oxidoreductase subunit C